MRHRMSAAQVAGEAIPLCGSSQANLRDECRRSPDAPANGGAARTARPTPSARETFQGAKDPRGGTAEPAVALTTSRDASDPLWTGGGRATGASPLRATGGHARRDEPRLADTRLQPHSVPPECPTQVPTPDAEPTGPGSGSRPGMTPPPVARTRQVDPQPDCSRAVYRRTVFDKNRTTGATAPTRHHP